MYRYDFYIIKEPHDIPSHDINHISVSQGLFRLGVQEIEKQLFTIYFLIQDISLNPFAATAASMQPRRRPRAALMQPRRRPRLHQCSQKSYLLENRKILRKNRPFDAIFWENSKVHASHRLVHQSHKCNPATPW